MLVEAANWRPEGKRSRADTLADPLLGHYIDGWPQPGDLGLVAEFGGKPAGAAWLRFFPASGPAYGFVAPEVPELVIGLRAECRGRGAGRALLRALADAARAAGHQADQPQRRAGELRARGCTWPRATGSWTAATRTRTRWSRTCKET